MDTVIETIATYEESVAQLREQQKPTLPTLFLSGDDCRFMDVSYIIEAINDLKDKLPEDCSEIAARIVADLALLDEKISYKNALIEEENEILNGQVSDLREALDTQLAGLPELKLTRAVKIGTKHMNEGELKVLAKVYDKLKVTHVNHEERKDLVYYNPEEQPELREKIIAAFYSTLEEAGTESTLEFRNYVHIETVGPSTSNIVSVIKSKR